MLREQPERESKDRQLKRCNEGLKSQVARKHYGLYRANIVIRKREEIGMNVIQQYTHSKEHKDGRRRKMERRNNFVTPMIYIKGSTMMSGLVI